VSKFESSDKDRLQEYLTQEFETFEQIQKLTEKITEQISTDKIEALDKSLEKRQELIEKINGLHQESSPLMQSYVSIEDMIDKEIEKLVAKIREIAEACAQKNNENMIAIKAKSEKQAEKIDKQSAQRKGISGYAQAVTYTPEVIDKKT